MERRVHMVARYYGLFAAFTCRRLNGCCHGDQRMLIINVKYSNMNGWFVPYLSGLAVEDGNTTGARRCWSQRRFEQSGARLPWVGRWSRTRRRDSTAAAAASTSCSRSRNTWIDRERPCCCVSPQRGNRQDVSVETGLCLFWSVVTGSST